MINAIEVDAEMPREPAGVVPDTTHVRTCDPQRARQGTDADQAFLPAGTRLFEYRIDKVLGHGGFGITYLARDTHLDKPVAIKEYLPAHLAVRNNTHVSARSPNEQRAFDWGRRQFLKEAQTLARFAHPNLVPVHRYFQAHETAYFVMSYVEGETLAARLKRDPTPSEDWLRSVLLPVMNGLKTVHRAGFLHRDIKPENILLQQDDTPVLIDFGAARVNLDSATRSTMCALTAGYAPLEQYGSAGHQGPWTDIYALGAVVYRAVTGRKPPEAVNRIHGDSLVPARVLGQGRYSEAFLDAVDWALSLHPEDRPRCVLDLQKALTGQARRERPVTVPTAPAPKTPARRTAAPEKIAVAAPAEARAESGFSFPWATAAAPMLAVGVVVGLFSSLRSGGSEMPASAQVVALPTPAKVAAQRAAAPEPLTPVPEKITFAAPAVESTASAAPKLTPAPAAVAQMEALSSFQDCQDCPAMAVLPAGRFVMGEAPRKGVSAWETPQREVALARAFAIGRYEVTAAQYEACVGAGACRKPLAAAAATDLPVVNVSWDDARAYVAWLSRKTGRRYRLPSETEWEYAARSGTHSPQFWGDSARRCRFANAAEPVSQPRTARNRKPVAAECGDGHAALAAVGSFKPNWFDLHDTAGNAWELTADCWRESHADAPRNGDAVGGKSCTRRAARGGSWRTPSEALRSSSRSPVASGHRSDTLGFRVVAE